MLPSSLRLKLPPKWNRNYPDTKVNTNLFKLLSKKIVPVQSSKAGFVISTKVGKAVTRNRLRRKLERLVLQRLAEDSSSQELIFIIYPACAGSSDEELSLAVNQALSKVHIQ
jgi:ribonuclease P protein component